MIKSIKNEKVAVLLLVDRLIAYSLPWKIHFFLIQERNFPHFQIPPFLWISNRWRTSWRHKIKMLSPWYGHRQQNWVIFLQVYISRHHKICENTGFHWSRIMTESTIISLYGRIRVSENPYSSIFYVVAI